MTTPDAWVGAGAKEVPAETNAEKRSSHILMRAAADKAIKAFSPVREETSFRVVDEKKDRICKDSHEQEEIFEKLIHFSHTNAPPSATELEYICRHPDSRLLFYNYLKTQHCEENLEFWILVERMKSIPPQEGEEPFSGPTSPLLSPRSGHHRQRILETHQRSRDSFVIHQAGLTIMDDYLSDMAAKAINIDYRKRAELLDVFESEDTEAIVESFESAQNDVFRLLFDNAFLAFRHDAQYIEFLEGNYHPPRPVTKSPPSSPSSNLPEAQRKMRKEDWIPDKEASNCMACNVPFTLILRRVCSPLLFLRASCTYIGVASLSTVWSCRVQSLFK